MEGSEKLQDIVPYKVAKSVAQSATVVVSEENEWILVR